MLRTRSASKGALPLRHSFLAAALALVVATGFEARAEPICALAGEPTILLEEGDPHAAGSRLLKVWEVDDDPVLWSDAVPDSEDYRDFRAELAELAGETDPVRLLQRSPVENNLLVARNATEWIKPAGCIEMLLIGHQHGRMNTFASPSEFASFILRSPGRDRLRIYYYTVNQDGIGRMTTLSEPVLADREAGWDVLVGLHSHVFHPGQPELDGILAPSIPDADFHMKFHAVSAMKEAWITNGVDTVRMPASSFGQFRSTE